MMKLLAKCVLFLVFIAFFTDVAAADTIGSVQKSGVSTYTRGELKQLGTQQQQQIRLAEAHYEYKTLDSCGATGSLYMTQDCATNQVTTLCPPTEGPLVDILRRLVAPTGEELRPWSLLGRTCRGNDVPGARLRPTMAMVVDAFHHTPWARATIGFQPDGYLTLVNLTSFYEAKWSATGYGPGSVDRVDPAAMLGHQVDIRPRLLSFTYHFGDGSSQGPTTSTGGVYPGGDIRHTYARSGTYAAYVTVVWGADFRVDGGAWAPVPATASVDEPAAVVTVREAHSHLVAS